MLHLKKFWVTKFAFERLFLLMNPTNMCIQVTFYKTLFVSKFTFKILLFFMNRSNMVQQASLFRKTMVTKFIFFIVFAKEKTVLEILSMIIFQEKRKNSKNHGTNLPPFK